LGVISWKPSFPWSAHGVVIKFPRDHDDIQYHRKNE
jgi:hypothetical protein